MIPKKPETSDLSELELALEVRLTDRKTLTFEAANFVGHDSKPLGKLRMRIATVAEQDNALKSANLYLNSKVQDVLPELREDLIGNAKIAFLMFACTRHETLNRPAFPSGAWMLEHMSTDELSVLLNHYNETVKLWGPVDLDLSEDRLEGLQVLLAKHQDTDAPNWALTRFSREQVSEIAIRFAITIQQLKERLQKLEDLLEAKTQ